MKTRNIVIQENVSSVLQNIQLESILGRRRALVAWHQTNWPLFRASVRFKKAFQYTETHTAPSS